jgi:CubicO group peptidase (beta-lactamase class C family)
MLTPEALEVIQGAFFNNFNLRGEVGASVSLWIGDSEICSLHHGFRDRERNVPWDAATIAPVWSATKGPAAAVTLLALHDRGLTPDSPIGEIWPELARGRLARFPLATLLSHQCGLAALDVSVPVQNHEAVVAALNAQAPKWLPGEGHGYHPRTFGFLVDELVRRCHGRPLGELWRDRIAEPLGLDFWISLPASEDHRVAEMLTPRAAIDPSSQDFYRALSQSGSLSASAFASPRGLSAVAEINQPETRRLALAGFGGIGSARALAHFYAVMASGGRSNGKQIIPEAVCEWAQNERSESFDKVLLVPTAFTAGFMRQPPSFPSGTFGHPGAGGSHAFADPARGLGFAYVMNQMERSVFPTEKALSLIRTLALHSE